MLTIDTASRTFHCKTWVTGQTQGKGGHRSRTDLVLGRLRPADRQDRGPLFLLRGRDISDCVLILLILERLVRNIGHALAGDARRPRARGDDPGRDGPVTVMGCLVNNIPLLQATGFDPFEQIQDGDLVRIDGENGTITSPRASLIPSSTKRYPMSQPYLQVIAHYPPSQAPRSSRCAACPAGGTHPHRTGESVFEYFQSGSDPCHFVILEKYRDMHGLDEHRQTAHFQAIGIGQIIPLLARREVESHMVTPDS